MVVEQLEDKVIIKWLDARVLEEVAFSLKIAILTIDLHIAVPSLPPPQISRLLPDLRSRIPNPDIRNPITDVQRNIV